jgi:prepilin-type N-terminal cleavage/methylation domain-containing protein
MVDRTTGEEGMTLIELLIALTVLAIGVMATAAGFSSGIFSVERGAKTSTAGALADKQMEAYRRLSFGDIATDTTLTGSADGTYTGDASYPGASWTVTGACPAPNTSAYYYCTPTRTTSSGGASYRIDSYVTWACPIPGSTLGGTVSVPTCSAVSGVANRAVKQVTIVVRDASTSTPTLKTLVRVTSTFDQSTS